MESSDSHMIIVSILEARNVFKDNYKCNDYLLVEARFNNESLLSDRKLVTSPSVELLTELCWELDRKSMQSLRKERKPIKLYCFLENEDQSEKQQIGYIVLDLREAQESHEPRFTWRPLLQSKYRGLSTNRPQLLVCLQFIKEGEGDHPLPSSRALDSISDQGAHNHNFANKQENGLERPAFLSQHSRPTSMHAKSSTEVLNGFQGVQKQIQNDANDLEADINVRFVDGVLHIYDSKRSNDCENKFSLFIIILKSSHLYKLIKLPAKLREVILFHFKIDLFGITLQSNEFTDLRSDGLRDQENLSFQLIIDHISTLHTYLQIYSLELQLCDNKNRVLGFTSINIAKIANQDFEANSKTLKEPKISGSFQLLPNDGSTCNEPYPTVDLIVELREGGPSSSGANSQSQFRRNGEPLPPIMTIPHHYCFTLDVRSISLGDVDHLSNGPCFVRYSYPLFRGREFQTSPIPFASRASYIFEDGLGTFNFISSPAKLETTFNQVPLTLELISESKKTSKFAIATAKLNTLYSSSPSPNQPKDIKNVHLPVITPNAVSIGEIHLILNLENYGAIENNDANDSSLLLRFGALAADSEDQSPNEIDDLLMDAVYEIEMWKKQQLELLEADLKKKENAFLKDLEERLRLREDEHTKEIIIRMNRIQELENKLKESLNDIELKSSILEDREKELDKRERNICERLEKLDEEISKTVMKNKDNLSRESWKDDDRTIQLNDLKSRLEERISHLEDKLDEKSRLIREYERKYGSILTSNKNSTGMMVKAVDVVPLSRSPAPKSATQKVNRLSLPANINSKHNPSWISGKNRPNHQLNEDKAEALLGQIERGKMELLESGLPSNHPIIKEIDLHLKR
ncbi:centrosomal protein of 120 kDa-like isoform X2 [Brevipalpus obovatus]|uniref:centrosomal protein of 120 kDa-like isoform X2 n=1 Tax=Brevipalpus obovatus TaxID=246614 RepID=UPI003D9F42F5